MLKNLNKKLIFIVLLGLALRFFGIGHSFPFIFHPDESTIVRSALGVRFNPNPGHFDWPHLYIYLNYFLFMVFAKVRDFLVLVDAKDFFNSVFPLVWNDDLIFYLLTRSFSAILGALTAIPIYLSTKNLFNEKTGLLAALAFVITPFHVWHSHYSLADVPMTFMMAWAMYYSTELLFRPNTKKYILAGLFVGLAATTKYNGAFAAVFVIAAHFLRVLSEKDEPIINLDGLGDLLVSGFSSIVGFVIGTPFALLDFDTFTRTDGPKGALWQFTNVGSVSFSEQIRTFFNVMSTKLPDDFGYVFFALFILSVFYTLLKSFNAKSLLARKDFMFLVTTGLFLLFFVSGLEKTRSHYFFIAYPSVIVAGVGMLAVLIEKIKGPTRALLLFVVLLAPLYLSVIGSYTFFRPDSRILLDNWLESNYSNKFVYYDGNDLRPVLTSHVGGVKKVDLNHSKFMQDSVFIVADGSRKDLRLIQSFDNKLRQGPIINVYKIE